MSVVVLCICGEWTVKERILRDVLRCDVPTFISSHLYVAMYAIAVDEL